MSSYIMLHHFNHAVLFWVVLCYVVLCDVFCNMLHFVPVCGMTFSIMCMLVVVYGPVCYGKLHYIMLCYIILYDRLKHCGNHSGKKPN